MVFFQHPTDDPKRPEPRQVVFIYNKKEYQIDFDKDGKIEPTHYFLDPSLGRSYFFIDTNNMIDILNKDIAEEWILRHTY